MLQATAIGHLGNDAILREINGKKVLNFSIAHSEKYKNAEGVQQERTTWVDCAYWSETAGVAPYLKKGVLVYLQGTPSIETYLSKEGPVKAAFRLRVNNIHLLAGSRQDGQASGAGKNPVTNNTPAPNEMAESVDDLPF